MIFQSTFKYLIASLVVMNLISIHGCTTITKRGHTINTYSNSEMINVISALESGITVTTKYYSKLSTVFRSLSDKLKYETTFILREELSTLTLLSVNKGTTLNAFFKHSDVLQGLSELTSNTTLGLIFLHTHQNEEVTFVLSSEKYRKYREENNLTSFPKKEIQRQFKLMKTGVIPYLYNPPSLTDLRLCLRLEKLFYSQRQKSLKSIVVYQNQVWVYSSNINKTSMTNSTFNEYHRLVVNLLSPYPKEVLGRGEFGHEFIIGSLGRWLLGFGCVC